MKAYCLIAAVMILNGSPLNSLTAQNGFAERMGMIESTDHGVTWSFRGHANFHAPALNPVDPTALFDNGLLVFYFFDLQSLSKDTAVVYRSVATDSTGLDFLPPEAAFKYAGDMTDPFVLKLPGGKYRMYVNAPAVILSATSSDGFNFTQDPGERTRTGGVPGAIILPDSTVRLFVCGKGITSLRSVNGLDFTDESGVRIPVPLGGRQVADPSPLYCSDGKYRMAYKVRPAGQGENPQLDEIYLAESTDGFSWATSSTSLAIGSVPTLVELPDGKLRMYYVDFQPDQPSGVFKFLQRVQVTPDTIFQTAGFVRVGYVPATNNLAVTFGGSYKHTINNLDEGYSYKEYALDMRPTGKSGALFHDGTDNGGLIVGNVLYAANMDPVGWHIAKYDAVSWKNLADITFHLDSLSEMNGDMMLAFVNGQLDLSSQTLTDGKPSLPNTGATTHHHFFTPDLVSLGERILSDTAHITGSSMIYVDNVYYFVSASAYTGDVVVMKYDNNWNYLGSRKLISQGHWSEGLAYDGKRFFVSYLDTRQRTDPTFFPYYPNVHIAAFDQDWNLLEDTAVTKYTPSDSLFPGRPSLLLLGNRLYVTYDVVPLPEDLAKIEGFVNVYEIEQPATSVESDHRVAEELSLEQNYPNPFNPKTNIEYIIGGVRGLGSGGEVVRLVVYDLLGREVAVLVNERQTQGRHVVSFDASRFASGAYFYRLTAGTGHDTKKLLLLR